MSGLKRCPFCGGEANIFKTKIYFGVMCKTPFCCNMAGYMTEEKAIKAWNTRKPLERIVERLEEEREESATDYYDWEDISYLRERDAYQKAIEIVRKEGDLNE